jgi:hypothetical protein
LCGDLGYAYGDACDGSNLLLEYGCDTGIGHQYGHSDCCGHVHGDRNGRKRLFCHSKCRSNSGYSGTNGGLNEIRRFELCSYLGNAFGDACDGSNLYLERGSNPGTGHQYGHGKRCGHLYGDGNVRERLYRNGKRSSNFGYAGSECRLDEVGRFELCGDLSYAYGDACDGSNLFVEFRRHSGIGHEYGDGNCSGNLYCDGNGLERLFCHSQRVGYSKYTGSECEPDEIR